jgi:hypothetical protein
MRERSETIYAENEDNYKEVKRFLKKLDDEYN